MTILVACLGEQTAQWEYMRKLIQGQQWEEIHLIAPRQDFECAQKVRLIESDTKLPLQALIGNYKKALAEIIDTEIALNIALGSGKEHMALLASLLSIGLGIRLVAYTTEGVREV